MKKEIAVIGMVVLAVVAFMLGRVSVDTSKSETPPQESGREAASRPPAQVTPAEQPAVADKVAEAAAPEAATATTVPSEGPADARVVIVEASDFQCPFCSRVIPTVKQLRDAYPNDVRVMFFQNPLGFHPNAMPAAKAALAAHRQGKFWEMHDKLFGNQRALSDDNYVKWAGELGLDVERFKKDMADPALQTEIERQQKAVVSLGSRGTPGFFINGELLSGAQPFEKFKEVVDRQLAEANKVVAAGTKASEAWAKVAEKSHPQGATFVKYVVNGETPTGPTAAPPQQDAQKKQQRPPADTTVWKVTVGPDEPVRGKKDALVKVVTFSEFQCPFCGRVEPTLAQVTETYGDDVALVFKHNPLPFHDHAMEAAEAALAAGDQGKFWEMHDMLFKNQGALDRPNLEKYAEGLGLDMTKWKAAMDSHAHKSVIARDMELATSVGARGAPNSYINGRQVTGAQPFEAFKTVIDEELAKAKRLVDGGTPRAKVYEEAISRGKTFRALDETAHTFSMEGTPIKGKANAKIVITEFSDFQCPYCSRVPPVLEQVKAAYGDDAAIAYKFFPLSFHERAKPAAIAALAAHEQGKFWEFQEKLFANQRDLTDENFVSWAKELGLDLDKFKASIANGKAQQKIDADIAEGSRSGVGGTPSLYINGRKFEPSGGYSLEGFKSLIDKEILGR